MAPPLTFSPLYHATNLLGNSCLFADTLDSPSTPLPLFNTSN